MRITNVFSNVATTIKAILQKDQGVTFSVGFTDMLAADRDALEQYRIAIEAGADKTAAFEATMRGASEAAQTFANTTTVTSDSISYYVTRQKMSEITLNAQNKSLANVRTLLNEYNTSLAEGSNGLTKCGLTQNQFAESVMQSNRNLGVYLSGLESGEATMGGYVGTLIGAKLATIGLRIATMALNAVIGMGIGLIISLISSGIMSVIEGIKENLKPIAEKLADVNEELKETQQNIKDIADGYKDLKSSTDEIIPRFVELASGVDRFGKNLTLTDDEYSEFLSLNNKIAEMFPELNLGMDENGNAMLNLAYSADTLTESLYALVEAQREQANQDLVDQLPNLVDGVKTKNDLLKQQIESYKSTISNYQNIADTFKGGSFTRNTWNYGNADGDWYAMYLKRLGIAYHTETVDSTYQHGTKGRKFKYIIDDMDAFRRILADSTEGVTNQIQNAEAQIANTWNSLNPSLTAWLKTNDTFGAFSEELQQVASSMLSNIDWTEHTDLDTKDKITGYIQNNILEPLSKADFDTQQALGNLLKITPDQFDSLDEYMNTIRSKILEIANMSDVDGLDYDSMFSSLGFDKIFSKYEEVLEGIKDKFPNISEEMLKSLKPDEIIEAFSYIKTAGVTSWGELVEYIANKKIVDAHSIKDIEALTDAIDDLQDAFDTLSDVIDDYNENGYISIDNFQDILSLGTEYINLLIDENGQLNLNTDSYYAYIEAKAKSLVIDQIKNLYETVVNMTAEEAQAYANAEAYDTEADSLLNVVKAMTSYYKIKAAARDAEENTTIYTEAFKRSIDTAANYMALYDNMVQNLSRSQSDLASSTSNATDALEEQKEALQDTLDELEDAQSAVKSLVDRVIDYIKKQKELEKDALQDQKDAFDDLIEAEKEKIRLKHEEIEADKTLANLQNSVAKDALAASIASLDDSAAGKKAYKKANDDLLSSRSDLYDELAEREYNTRIDALDKLKEAQDDYYDSEIQKIEDYLDQERKIYEDACYMIDHDTGDLYGKLWDYTYKYTTETKAEFDYMWNEAQSALSRYRDANIDLLTVLEMMQTDIYRINGEINTLSSMIDDESSSVNNLASSWANATANALAYRQALIDEANTPKWYFKWKDVYGNVHTYESVASDQIDAVNDILSQLGWDSRGGKYVKEHMYHYARGTLSAPGGLAEINEDGHEIRVLNKGDGILTAQITKNLSNLGATLGSNPVQFLADVGKELWSKISGSGAMSGLFGITPTAAAAGVGSSGDMPITIVNHINGDVNPSTLKALEKAQKQITNDAINGVFKKTLGLRNSSRVR